MRCDGIIIRERERKKGGSRNLLLLCEKSGHFFFLLLLVLVFTTERVILPMTTNRRNSSDMDTLEKTASSLLQSQVFENMRLRRMVKENHATDIMQVGFFFNTKNFDAPVSFDSNKTFDKRGAVQRDESDTSNVLGTVGGCQLSVYDNEHCGDHLDIMSNYDLSQLEPEEDDDDGYYKLTHELVTFCWLYRNGGAYLATAGTDTEIHILSLSRSQEEQSLQGHTSTAEYIYEYKRYIY